MGKAWEGTAEKEQEVRGNLKPIMNNSPRCAHGKELWLIGTLALRHGLTCDCELGLAAQWHHFSGTGSEKEESHTPVEGTGGCRRSSVVRAANAKPWIPFLVPKSEGIKGEGKAE